MPQLRLDPSIVVGEELDDGDDGEDRNDDNSNSQINDKKLGLQPAHTPYKLSTTTAPQVKGELDTPRILKGLGLGAGFMG